MNRKLRYQNFYQFALILFAFLVMFGIGAFVYNELFPEYKTYQYAYKDLEKFRSEYTQQEAAIFFNRDQTNSSGS